MSSSIEIFPDSDILVAAAGKRLVGAIGAAVAARGQALIVLTGGGNGIALLRYLSAQAQQIEWSKVHLFWGDERYVPEDDDERNLKQARRALLNHVDIPSNQVHPMAASDGDFGGDLDAAAWPTNRCWPPVPHQVTRRRISTSTCWAWGPRATLTRCSRTAPPSSSAPAWWWRSTTRRNRRHAESP